MRARVKLSSESIANAGALILGGVGLLLFKLGGWLWRGGDDALADFPEIGDET